MYSSLSDEVFVNSFIYHMRTVYVVSDSQLEEIKRINDKKNLIISGLLVRSWKKVIKLESKCLMNMRMNFKRRSKLLLQPRRIKRKSLLSKYVQLSRDNNEEEIFPLFSIIPYLLESVGMIQIPNCKHSISSSNNIF